VMSLQSGTLAAQVERVVHDFRNELTHHESILFAWRLFEFRHSGVTNASFVVYDLLSVLRDPLRLTWPDLRFLRAADRAYVFECLTFFINEFRLLLRQFEEEGDVHGFTYAALLQIVDLLYDVKYGRSGPFGEL